MSRPDHVPSELHRRRLAHRRRQTVHSVLIAAASTGALGVALVVAVTGAPGWERVRQSFLDVRIARDALPPIVDGLLRIAEVCTLVGPAKTSKTWFALALAVAVATGETFLGRETRTKKVLYLDYELKPSVFRKRLCMVAGSPPEGLVFQCFRGVMRLPSRPAMRACSSVGRSARRSRRTTSGATPSSTSASFRSITLSARRKRCCGCAWRSTSAAG